jgi:hypothetical protein
MADQPNWVMAELPPKYQELAAQIAALMEQTREYEALAGALWQTGPPLTHAVASVFHSLKCETELMDNGSNYDVRAQLEGGQRFLIHVVGGTAPVDRKSPEIARILRTLQEDADEHDRVLLALNISYDLPPASRKQDLAAPEALRLIQGLGANLVPTSTLFGLWKYSLHDAGGARKSLIRLHELKGGIFR